MKNLILSNLSQAATLEKLYRQNPSAFKSSFLSLYDEIKESPAAVFWYERLQTDQEVISWGNRQERWLIFISAILTGFLMKLPSILSLEVDTFYAKNTGFLAFGSLVFFFSWRNQVPQKTRLFMAAVGLLSLIHINWWPSSTENDTFILACMHLPFLMWGLFGISYQGTEPFNLVKRLEFIRLNGEIVVLSTVLLLSGGILSGMTIGLFELIGISMSQFFMENIVLFLLPSVPLLTGFILIHNPTLVNRVSPMIAKIFSPLVLIMLIAYLISMPFSPKSIYTDREFLLLFNLLLIGVMALIAFSVSENAKTEQKKLQTGVLFTLASVTILVNSLALHAISLRIVEFGWTPNRVAVLGSNILMLVHLLLVTKSLWFAFWDSAKASSVGLVLVKYLPVYLLWIAIVVFGLPFFFGF